jgi:hypothetical protein
VAKSSRCWRSREKSLTLLEHDTNAVSHIKSCIFTAEDAKIAKKFL